MRGRCAAGVPDEAMDYCVRDGAQKQNEHDKFQDKEGTRAS